MQFLFRWRRSPIVLICTLSLVLTLALAAQAAEDTGACAQDGIWPPAQPANTLSDEEREAGWILLFDGTDSFERQWTGWGQQTVPSHWQAVDGCLVNRSGSTDLVTRFRIRSYELKLEYRLTAGANSGIFIRADDRLSAPNLTSPEFQVLDDARHPDGRNPMTSAGASYAIFPRALDVSREAGRWNQVHIIVDGDHVQFYLNKVKTAEYDMSSPEFAAAVAASHFGAHPQYGKLEAGQIVLQAHTGEVWYRDIKIRMLP